jgi:lipoprotein signal peptidase
MKTVLKHVFFIMGILLFNFLIQDGLKANSLDLGIIKLSLVFNTGFIFGLFNEASSSIRIVLTSVMVGILVLLACYFYEFLHPSLKKLRWGITLTLAGIIGNGMEKLFYGHVWDFINLSLPYFSRFVFNLNDILQIIGLAILVYEIYSKQNVIWFREGEKMRKTTLIYRHVQLPILLKVMGLIFISSLTQAILTVALLFPELKRGSQDIQLVFFLCIFLLNLAILPLLGKYLLKELLRCLGPVFAMERLLNNEITDKTELKFRKTDHFQSLEVAFNEFLKKKIQTDKKD